MLSVHLHLPFHLPSLPSSPPSSPPTIPEDLPPSVLSSSVSVCVCNEERGGIWGVEREWGGGEREREGRWEMGEKVDNDGEEDATMVSILWPTTNYRFIASSIWSLIFLKLYLSAFTLIYYNGCGWAALVLWLFSWFLLFRNFSQLAHSFLLSLLFIRHIVCFLTCSLRLECSRMHHASNPSREGWRKIPIRIPNYYSVPFTLYPFPFFDESHLNSPNCPSNSPPESLPSRSIPFAPSPITSMPSLPDLNFFFLTKDQRSKINNRNSISVQWGEARSWCPRGRPMEDCRVRFISFFFQIVKEMKNRENSWNFGSIWKRIFRT